MKKIFNKKNFLPVALITAIIIIGIVMYLIFFTDQNKNLVYGDYTIYEGHKGTVEKYDQSLTVDGYEKSDKAYYITGKISAKEEKSFSLITFDLYDKKDNLLGQAKAGLNELQKNKTYGFRALAIVTDKQVEKIDHYKLHSIELN